MVVGDLAQSDDRILVIVAGDSDLRAGRNHPGAVTRHQDEIKSIFDFDDAIFDRDARHGNTSTTTDNKRDPGSYTRNRGKAKEMCWLTTWLHRRRP